jgi:hypothetical protein
MHRSNGHDGRVPILPALLRPLMDEIEPTGDPC